MGLLQRVKRQYEQGGLRGILSRGPASLLRNVYLRAVCPALPTVRHANWNGVAVPSEVVPKRKLGDGLFAAFLRTDYPSSEGGEVTAHHNFTQPGDTVVIIGGGRGVSTVHAAWESGPDGRVMVFEGSERYARIISEVVALNNVSERCTIETAVVGEAVDVFDSAEQTPAEQIPVKSLPQCDVLEMDCEGAEAYILAHLEQRPRVLIIEIHPGEVSARGTLEQIRTMGYDVVRYWTNEGVELTRTEFDDEQQRGGPRTCRRCSPARSAVTVVSGCTAPADGYLVGTTRLNRPGWLTWSTTL